MNLRKLFDSAPGVLLEGHVWIKFALENLPNQNKLFQRDEPILNFSNIALRMDIQCIQMRTINTITRGKWFCSFSEQQSCAHQPLLESFFFFSLSYICWCENVRIRQRRNAWNTLIKFSIRFSVLVVRSLVSFHFNLFPPFLHSKWNK